MNDDSRPAGSSTLGFNATWSMAVGGMIGGGIFSTLGVVIAISGSLAWLSFVFAGLIAMASGYSYVRLVSHYRKGGGAFTFLREIDKREFAGSLAWILIVGYVLTNAVYAFTFGQYIGHVLGSESWLPRAAAVAIMGLFIGLNLREVGEAGLVEVALVWFKLIVLVGLAGWGLAHWDAARLSEGIQSTGLHAAVFGAVSVFMAYEGFQLLAYDYEDIDTPERTLPRAVLSAIVVVIVVYVLVALGTPMLIGADEIVQHKEVALSIAGQRAFGMAGLVIVTIGAAVSTGSAINATLFATARLAANVAEHGQLPAALTHANAQSIPDRAVVALGILAAIFAAMSRLTVLVEAASLSFLVTFTVVNWLAFRLPAGNRLVTGFGTVSGAAASLALSVRLAETSPWSLASLALVVVVAVFVRPIVLRHSKTEHDDS